MRLAFLVVSLAFAVGCTNTNNGDDGMPVDCSTVTGADTFTVGLEKMGVAGSVDFKLMSIDPAPAISGNNTWIVQIDSMASGVVGSPMDGATVEASPFMPAHQHGSPLTPIVTATGNPGEYQITRLNLWMPGVWETTISVKTATPPDRAVYAFCIN